MKTLLTFHMIVGAHVEIFDIPQTKLHRVHPVVTEIFHEVVDRLRCSVDNIVESQLDLIEWQKRQGHEFSSRRTKIDVILVKSGKSKGLNPPMNRLSEVEVTPMMMRIWKLKKREACLFTKARYSK